MKQLILLTSILIALPAATHANLVLLGVIDGDLPSGNPKAVLIEATADIADLSTFGIGSSTNGTGSPGQEFGFPITSINTGQHIIIAANAASHTFFSTNYVSDFLLLQSGAATINGDDAIELYAAGSVIDTYGDVNMSGTGESWDYTDGYAIRTGGTAGAFLQANYSSNAGALDTLNEAAHISTIGTAFGLTPVPEPSAVLLGLLGLCTLMLHRRS